MISIAQEQEAVAQEPQTVPSRRRELAAFLRARRERIRPEDVGLIAGPRRHTPGLRREELAQLAGVGMTWYTWLEQGRPINVSSDVLDAVARALRLDQAEQEHLYRLAEVTAVRPDPRHGSLDAEVQVILDGLLPFPASVINSRYDLLAWNAAYGAFFPAVFDTPPIERNLLWQLFVKPESCALLDREQEVRKMVATLRSAFARHLDEPSWTEFVRRLSAASQEFAALWERHDVAEPRNHLKRFRAPDGATLVMYSTVFAVTGAPEARMSVLTPADAATADRLALRP